MGAEKKSVLLIGCGALMREIKALKRIGGWDHVSIQCLSADLHNTPEKIPAAVAEKLEDAGDRFDQVFVAYADCGTGGQLDAVLAGYGAEHLAGSHCYEFFSGAQRFAELHDAQPGTFYLTDFLVRHFNRLVICGLGLDRHPELLHDYFGNYKRVVYLAQAPTRELEMKARECAQRLGLDFEIHFTGLKPFSDALGVMDLQLYDHEREP